MKGRLAGTLALAVTVALSVGVFPAGAKQTHKAPKAASQVLWQDSGSGTQQSPYFTAPNNWNVDWSYNCASFGSQGNFIVSVMQNGTGSMASIGDPPIDELGASGSGVMHYHYAGKLYLSVTSECSWMISAVRA